MILKVNSVYARSINCSQRGPIIDISRFIKFKFGGLKPAINVCLVKKMPSLSCKGLTKGCFATHVTQMLHPCFHASTIGEPLTARVS